MIYLIHIRYSIYIDKTFVCMTFQITDDFPTVYVESYMRAAFCYDSVEGDVLF